MFGVIRKWKDFSDNSGVDVGRNRHQARLNSTDKMTNKVAVRALTSSQPFDGAFIFSDVFLDALRRKFLVPRPLTLSILRLAIDTSRLRLCPR